MNRRMFYYNVISVFYVLKRAINTEKAGVSAVVSEEDTFLGLLN